MRKATILYKNESEILNVLMDFGIPHHVFLTNNSTKIKCSDATYLVSDRHLSFKDLAFIQKVKRYAEKVGKPKSIYDSKDIQYFKMYHKKDGLYTDVVEMDVNKAYWQIAYNLGYLSKEIYEKGLEVDKMTRLISFGSVATNKAMYKYIPDFKGDGGQVGKYDYQGEEINKVTRSYFFEVAKRLDIIMGKVARKIGKENILFYWVDAFFVKRSAVPYMTYLIEQEGLSLKKKEISSISFQKQGSVMKVLVVEKGEISEKKCDITIKPFCYQLGNRNKQAINETLDLVNRFKS